MTGSSLSALADRSSRATDAGIRFGFKTWGFWARLAVPGSICVLEILKTYIHSVAVSSSSAKMFLIVQSDQHMGCCIKGRSDVLEPRICV